MRIKIVTLLALSTAALWFTGCDQGRAQMGSRESNLLGIAKIEKDNYGPTTANTFAVHTDELYKRKNFSGDRVTLLWGLVTLKDY
ncbi:hypothetical protein [Coraliomargarita sinensis]|uniref:hypothetical protein n=1 Tax=Coraliomargarita sinensis TaxID=2174842 RepID=UPI0011B676AB|nr:hypothetical protein [Coraliomargarita sinensis]